MQYHIYFSITQDIESATFFIPFSGELHLRPKFSQLFTNEMVQDMHWWWEGGNIAAYCSGRDGKYLIFMVLGSYLFFYLNLQLSCACKFSSYIKTKLFPL